MKLTMQITKGENYFIGTIKEIPAVLTQGSTVADVKENILDALELYLEDMREENATSEVVYQEDLIFA
jgi:predicted RNase H-like HicB family nuclease